MPTLLFSLLPLFTGPLLGTFLAKTPILLAGLDGFVLAAILGLVSTHLLPEAIATLGMTAVPLALLGLLLPAATERLLSLPKRRAHGLVAALALLGIGFHAALEGAALAKVSPAHHGGSALLWSVLLHRVPLSLTVWWTLRPLVGGVRATAALLGLAFATCAGFGGAEALSEVVGAPLEGLVAALVAGGLVHVAWHQPHDELSAKHPSAAAIGVLGGLLLLWLCPDEASHGVSAMSQAFLHLVLEAAPALALGFTTAGLVGVMLPQAGVSWLRTGGQVSQALRGLVFGLPLPLCSCGVVPLYRSLRERGAPATACLAFLVATPELGLDAILLSLPLLGVRMTLARLAGAAVLALFVAVIVGRGIPEDPEDCTPAEPPPRLDRGSQLRAALRHGWGEVVDHTGPWILVGFLAAAALEPFGSLENLATLPPMTQTLLLIAIGLPLYLCASAATPLAAVLLQQGVSPGAVLAFLLSGPASNWTTFGVLSRLHGTRIASIFVGSMALGCLGVAASVNSLPISAGGHSAGVAVAHGGEPGLVSWLATGLLACAFLRSLLTLGPRAWIGELLGGAHDHSHDHGAEAHAHGCDHHDHSHDHGAESHAHGCVHHDHSHDHGAESHSHECDLHPIH